MNPIALRATVLNIAGNTFLFILKLAAGITSGSIALISDALNSLTDIVSSIAIFICVRISDKKADEDHPFGHARAEPLAGLIVAIFAGILGFELIRSSVARLLAGDITVEINAYILAVPIITMAVKLVMARYFKRTAKAVNSPAIMASAVDSMLDVGISAAALIGIVGVSLGYPVFDPAAGLFISFWIIYTGYKIGVENIDYLMGKAPSKELLEEIRSAALAVTGVGAVNTVRAHYVGNFIHVEIHVEVDKNMKTKDSHAVSDMVEDSLDKIEAIDKSFVHIDPV
ncbi:MAG: cation diffusion facilitator family transporter [Thermodesulfobacteriota bacterium]